MWHHGKKIQLIVENILVLMEKMSRFQLFSYLGPVQQSYDKTTTSKVLFYFKLLRLLTFLNIKRDTCLPFL